VIVCKLVDAKTDGMELYQQGSQNLDFINGLLPFDTQSMEGIVLWGGRFCILEPRCAIASLDMLLVKLVSAIGDEVGGRKHWEVTLRSRH
jgi:hypothetical protein